MAINKKIKVVVITMMTTILIMSGAVAFLVTTINQDVIKKKAAQLVYDKTGRELKINGDISWTFFPWLGIKMQNVSLGNPSGFNNGYLAYAKKVSVNIKVLPLFSKQIEIGHLTLKDFDLQLIKNNSGKNNWQNLLTPNNATNPVTVNNDNKFNITKFTIGNIAIKNGSIFWQDQKTNKKIKINKFDLHCKDIDFKHPFAITIAFYLDDLASLLHGAVAASAKATLNPNKKLYEFKDIQLTGKLKNKTSEKTFDLDGNADIKIEKALATSSFDMHLDDIKIQGKAEYTSSLNLKLAITNISMQTLLKDLANYEKFSGTLSLRTNININTLSGDGDILINHGSYWGIDIPYEVRRTHAILNVKPLPEKSNPPHTDFDQLTMSFKINNAILTTNDLLIQAPNYKVIGQGNADVSSQYLNLLLKAYSTHDEKFLIPVKITGAFNNPSVKFDVAVILQHSIKKIIKNVKNVIDDQLGKQLLNLPQELKNILSF